MKLDDMVFLHIEIIDELIHWCVFRSQLMLTKFNNIVLCELAILWTCYCLILTFGGTSFSCDSSFIFFQALIIYPGPTFIVFNFFGIFYECIYFMNLWYFCEFNRFLDVYLHIKLYLWHFVVEELEDVSHFYQTVCLI